MIPTTPTTPTTLTTLTTPTTPTTLTTLTTKTIDKYIEQLSDTEKNMIKIAEQTLGSSFNISRSLGYIKWKETE
jgi:hypothetical protein